MNAEYPFERPVIILAAPRSGSTLLFETLALSKDFWTIGGESHGVFERIQQFNPMTSYCDSNALSADDATPVIIRHIRSRFFRRLRNTQGRRFHQSGTVSNFRPRLLEKTPKNALRVSLLNAIFPDALYIYLYRNPRENVSSMMDAWESSRFVTYRSLPGRNGSWSLLLPPGWQSYNDASLEEIAAFQWKASNTAILRELTKLEHHRWIAVSYGQQVDRTAETVQRVCHFCGVSADAILDAISVGQTRLSRYTVTPPTKDKWHKNALALNRIMSGLTETNEYIRRSATELPADEFDLSIDAALLNGHASVSS